MTQPYYVDQGRSHDCLLRCKDCRALVTFATIQKIGSCDACGNRRFAEITILSEKEQEDIRSGAIAFPDSEKFLAEFNQVEFPSPAGQEPALA